MAEGHTRPAWAEVDLSAVRHNVGVLRACAAPAAVCAVVKAGAYGHGAVPVARAALEGGAAGLAVALVDEGVELREAGIGAPVLVLSEPPDTAAEVVVTAGLTPTVATPGTVRALGAAARRAGTRLAVHMKVDTGMHRVGVAPEAAAALAAAVAEEPALRLEGVFTHLAVADGTGPEERAFTEGQLERFDAVVAGLGARPQVLHAANTAGAVAWPAARYDMVRCGIGIYGLAPSPVLVDGSGRVAEVLAQLRPALSLRARVSAVRELGPGSRPSYGRLRPLPDRAVVATVPLGYADGVPRALFGAGCTVLVGGRRRPLAGMVTMDQIVVDCGPDAAVAVGDEVVLIGDQGGEAIAVSEWARMLGTVDYEVVCGIGARVARRYVGQRTLRPAARTGRRG